MIVTYVSTYNLQRQSDKGKLRSNRAAKSLRVHIEHINTNVDFPVEHSLQASSCTVRPTHLCPSLALQEEHASVPVISSLLVVTMSTVNRSIDIQI